MIFGEKLSGLSLVYDLIVDCAFVIRELRGSELHFYGCHYDENFMGDYT